MQKLIIIGPKGLKEVMHRAITFSGDYWNFLELIELPDQLNEPLKNIDNFGTRPKNKLN